MCTSKLYAPDERNLNLYLGTRSAVQRPVDFSEGGEAVVVCCTSAAAHMYVVWSCSTLFLPRVRLVFLRSYEVTKEIATGPTYPGKDKAVFEVTRTYSRLECAIHKHTR